MDIVDQPLLQLSESVKKLKECGLGLVKVVDWDCKWLTCFKLVDALEKELDKCAKDFYKACKFGDIVGPECRFGPLDKFKVFQYEQLEVRVKALETLKSK